MRKLRNFFSGRLFPFALSALLIAAGGLFLALKLPRLLAPVAAAERAFSVAAALYCLSSADLPEVKQGKLLLILLFPWTGALLCFFLRAERAFPALCSLPARGSMEQFAALAAAPLTGAKTADYFPTGGEMFRALLKDIEGASASVFLEYYIVSDGALLDTLLPLLAEKTQNGVDVRLIFDDFGSSLTLSRRGKKRLRAAGVRYARSRPLRPFGKFNRRDHRKIAVIDGKTAYTGGVNLADEYIGKKIRFGHWKDTALRLTGAAAAAFSDLFAKHWNALSAKDPIPMSEVRKDSSDMPCVVFADDGELPHRGARLFSRLISGAERTLFLCTPYLAPDRTLFETLCGAAAAGVDVRLMIPHIPDKKPVFLLTRSYARGLAAAGVKVREYTDGFLHAKSAAADGEYALVSSYNLDFRSLFLQAECGALVKDKALAAHLGRDFCAAWEGGSELPVAGTLEKWLCAALRLFAPLL